MLYFIVSLSEVFLHREFRPYDKFKQDASMDYVVMVVGQHTCIIYSKFKNDCEVFNYVTLCQSITIMRSHILISSVSSFSSNLNNKSPNSVHSPKIEIISELYIVADRTHLL